MYRSEHSLYGNCYSRRPFDDWQMAGESLYNLQLTATGKDFAYDIAMRGTDPLMLHGDRRYSVKSAKGQASYYYSQPFFTVTARSRFPTAT